MVVPEGGPWGPGFRPNHIIVSHRVGEQLQVPLGGSLPKGEDAEWGVDSDRDRIDGGTSRDL